MLLSRILRLRLDYSVSPILFVCSLQLSPELHVASFRTSSEAPQDWLVYNSALSLPPSSQILMGSAIEKNTSSIVNRSTSGRCWRLVCGRLLLGLYKMFWPVQARVSDPDTAPEAYTTEAMVASSGSASHSISKHGRSFSKHRLGCLQKEHKAENRWNS